MINNINVIYIICSRTGVGPRERLPRFSTRSVVIVLSFLLHLPPLSRLVTQAGMVSAEDTLTIKSVRVSAFDCQSIVDNDLPSSWILCLFILP